MVGQFSQVHFFIISMPAQHRSVFAQSFQGTRAERDVVYTRNDAGAHAGTRKPETPKRAKSPSATSAKLGLDALRPSGA